jgi:hypothetical protein
MRTCTRQEDCRPGYECVDVGKENPWSAQVIQKNPGTTKICAVPSSAALPDPKLLSDLPENVCGGAMSGGIGGAAGASSE